MFLAPFSMRFLLQEVTFVGFICYPQISKSKYPCCRHCLILFPLRSFSYPRWALSSCPSVVTRSRRIRQRSTQRTQTLYIWINRCISQGNHQYSPTTGQATADRNREIYHYPFLYKIVTPIQELHKYIIRESSIFAKLYGANMPFHHTHTHTRTRARTHTHTYEINTNKINDKK